ncbi:hypothetical protein FE257_004568 [Aspergillus nanangensis]|uniref:Uncharacterized protein n=1 Tax=Aspergillus nanangensis TaxID=2582783 RepID=A0AAD4CYA0_ASPNN|nr:hypothetical protein FE257_004568 [Aspergillus nanangensis]
MTHDLGMKGIQLWWILDLYFAQTATAEAENPPMISTTSNRTPTRTRVLSPYDKFVLFLGGAVLLACAIALLTQTCRIWAFIVQRELLWSEDDDPELYWGKAHGHTMYDLESGKYAPTSSACPFMTYTTRYGSITQQSMQVNGIQKLVLVANVTTSLDEAPDAYADWFQRWRRQREEEEENEAEESHEYTDEQSSDEHTPLMGAQAHNTQCDSTIVEVSSPPEQPLSERRRRVLLDLPQAYSAIHGFMNRCYVVLGAG